MTTEPLISPAEPVTCMKVVVTFMRMLKAPSGQAPVLPDGWEIVPSVSVSVAEYRRLHHRVGAEYCWWMRQAQPDAALERLLASGNLQIGYLLKNGAVRGFFELDLSNIQFINLNYFGLFPEVIGAGVGRRFLDAVIRLAWSYYPVMLQVNTCSADHPRALPLYRDAGFEVFRELEEVWPVPQRLGLIIPERFRI
ncbi:GNAT family N-acetyltransferase [Acetobacter thailandicus]|nr:GNAT family N-acetyltransferase [Acetobacter thailandicus]NHN94948.1 GNAT family N-acetyltransferase [Acetobacter thailandicus]OUI88512.1 acetyltransferase [Acetobacter sp. DmW_043]